MNNLKTAMLFFHGLTITIVLYLSSFLLSTKFDSSSDKTIFITLGTIIFINSFLRISILRSPKRQKKSTGKMLLHYFFKGLQFLVTSLLIVDWYMRNIGSLEKGLICLLLINAVLGVIYWYGKAGVRFGGSFLRM